MSGSFLFSAAEIVYVLMVFSSHAILAYVAGGGFGRDEDPDVVQPSLRVKNGFSRMVGKFRL